MQAAPVWPLPRWCIIQVFFPPHTSQYSPFIFKLWKSSTLQLLWKIEPEKFSPCASLLPENQKRYRRVLCTFVSKCSVCSIDSAGIKGQISCLCWIEVRKVDVFMFRLQQGWNLVKAIIYIIAKNMVIGLLSWVSCCISEHVPWNDKQWYSWFSGINKYEPMKCHCSTCGRCN